MENKEQQEIENNSKDSSLKENIAISLKCAERMLNFIDNYGGAYDDAQEIIVRLSSCLKKI